PIQVLDRFIDLAASRGIALILDMHDHGGEATRNNITKWYSTGGPNDQSPSVFHGFNDPSNQWTGNDGKINEQQFIDTWLALAQRYGNKPAVIGADLWNEPRSMSWDMMRDMADRVGSAILRVAPRWLIIVEGVADTANKDRRPRSFSDPLTNG